jgi:acyl-CoA reductase-like NAD-dependent aldehyde dehydrogenase
VNSSNRAANSGATSSTRPRKKYWHRSRWPRRGSAGRCRQRQNRLRQLEENPIGTRARIFLKYQQLIREHMKELAALLTAEQGKTLADAEGDIFRGLEVVEHAASIGNLQLGEYAENVAGGVDTYTVQQPLGVCAGITPSTSRR